MKTSDTQAAGQNINPLIQEELAKKKQFALVYVFQDKEPEECAQIVKKIICNSLSLQNDYDDQMCDLLEIYRLISDRASHQSGFVLYQYPAYIQGLDEMQRTASNVVYSCTSRIPMPSPKFQSELLQYMVDVHGYAYVFSMLLIMPIRKNHSEIVDFYKNVVRKLCETILDAKACDEILENLVERGNSGSELFVQMVTSLSIARVKKTEIGFLLQEAQYRKQARQTASDAEVERVLG